MDDGRGNGKRPGQGQKHGGHALTTAQFGALAEMPAELEWLANVTNPQTRRTYKIDVEEFIAFAALRGLPELRSIPRAHVIARRKDLEKRALADSTMLRKLSLSALLDYLCERNARACQEGRRILIQADRK